MDPSGPDDVAGTADPPTIHPTAVIAADTVIGSGVYIGPFAVVDSRAVVGDGARIGDFAVIGRGCRVGASASVGEHAVLYSDVTLAEGCVVESGACVGSDGFGFAFAAGRWHKIPQVGSVRIAAGTRVRANSTIDRGSVGDTRIGRSTSLGPLAHIGHNVSMGDECAMEAQSGVAGSARIGSSVRLGVQTATLGHIRVEAGVEVEGWSGASKDVPPGARIRGVLGRPARDARFSERVLARAPRILRRLRRVLGAAPAAREGAP